MTSSDARALFTERLSDGRGDAAPSDDLVAFGWLRGTRDSAPMLELRKKTGSILAIGYGWLERIEFDPSIGILLDVGDQRIAIRGRNLNGEVRAGVRLFEGLTRHRVTWIQEASNVESLQADERSCVVDSIDW